MRRSGWWHPLRLRLALTLVSSLRWLVPAHRRPGWLAEWRAELRHRSRRERAGAAPGPGLLRRSLSAIPHALTLLCRQGRLRTLLHDVRFAGRRLRRSPGFIAGVILTLAIGIGATTAIFSVLHSTLLDPLPFPGGDRLVFLMKAAPERSIQTSPRSEDIALWRERTTSFEEIVAYASETVVLTGTGEPREDVVLRVTPGFFSFLGTGPTLGRGFADDEGRSDARVAVVSHGFWRTELGGDPDVLGRELTLDGEAWTIVGVLPRGFRFRAPFDSPHIWLPFPADRAEEYPSPWAVARLRPGISLEAANEEIAAIPTADTGFGAAWVGSAQRLQDLLGATFPTAVMALQVAVILVLLVAAANVANLLMARATVDRQEMAIRAALGADRHRLVRQLLLENFLLAAAGGLVGLLLARGGLSMILHLRPERLSQLDAVRVDGTVLAFASAVSAATGLVFGVVPALRASRPDIVTRLTPTSRAGDGRRGNLLRNGLVAAEIALSALLLVGAGLMLNSMGRLLGTDLGFRPAGVLTFSISLPEARYPHARSVQAFHEELERRLLAAGGDRIESVAFGSLPPSPGIVFGTYHAEGEEVLPAFENLLSMAGSASPGYFETLEIPLLDGRGFVPGDRETEETPVIVNAAWARRMWGETRVAGRRIVAPGDPASVHPVVGVVADARLGGPLHSISEVQLFFPERRGRQLSAVLRTRTDPLDLAPLVEEQVWAMDPDLPVKNLGRLESRMADTVGAQRFHTTLMTVFAAVALALAVVGVYGVLAYAVGRRTREIGVRMALGASRRRVLPMVVWQGMRVVLLGMALGIAGAFGLTRYLGSLLYEVDPVDPPTYAVVATVLAAVAAVACYLPARRAARVDPMAALRSD